MKILALDSSGMVATVAILEDNLLIAEYTTNYKKTHSQTLVPMLDQMSQMIELDMKTVTAIAVAAGPGSFTGLRIGSATAKGLGLALKIPVISVPTVEALAYNLYGTKAVICPIMDARRDQVYTGIYEWNSDNLVVLKDQCAVPMEEIIDELNKIGKDVIFIGDGIPVFAETICSQMKVKYSFAPTHLCRQRAGAVGALAMKYYQEGRYENAAEHQPKYLRLSQAEREKAEKGI